MVVGKPLGQTLAVLTLLCCVPTIARAEVYTWTDKDGVIHFTNVPDHPNARPLKVAKKENTFSWTDGLGKMREVHRVDITRFDPIIEEAAKHYSLPPALIKAVIATESAFESKAVSHAGAQGLMQLMPQTAAEMKVHDPFEPRANIFGGARYLRIMLNTFDGDIRLAAAAYNAGPHRVKAAGGVPAIGETQTYVKRVLKLYYHYLKTWQQSHRK